MSVTDRQRRARLREIFDPVFARIAEGAVERELARELPFEPVSWLREVRFGALRVPEELGGYGASVADLLELLIALAEADSNVAHIFRGHVAVVEELLAAPDGAHRTRWLERLAEGEIVGNAMTEPGAVELGRHQTVLAERDGRHLLTGVKAYSTGAIFADWADATATRESDGAAVSLFVRLDQPGVELVDDWDGFGQRLTGTGTTRFADAEVEAESIRERTERVGYLSALFQLALLAVVAGVARRASRDVAGLVARRTRIYGSGNADLARDDVQIQQVVGELSSAAYAAHSLVTGLAGVVEEALAQARSGDAELARDAARVVDYDVYRVQVVLAELVPTALSRGFGALGSSAVRVSAALDRHWRNARTVLSHNPVVYRARLIGDLEINDRVPESVAGIGVAPSTLAALRDAETASATHTQEHA